MTETAVEFRGVVKRYGDAVAVAGIDLAITKGELVTFLGPSGCGKTTSLRLIAGLELPTEGQVFIAGRDVSRDPASARNVGMVFQSYALFSHMNVLDNVAYGPVIRGTPKAQARAREILDQVGLGGLHQRLSAELSGGQQQRVAVARAIVQQPDVILFDEPLSNVDAKLRRKVREEIRSLQRRFGLTAVYVTHDQEEALAVSDRIVVMDRGRIAQVGTPADLYERPATPFIADFIGDANLIRGDVMQGRFTAPGMVIDVTGPDGPATLSIRPERITLMPGGPDRVITATDLGSRMEYTVAAQVGEMLVSRPIHEARLTAGQDVALPITATDVSRVAKGPQMPGIRTRFDLACRLANDGGALALAYFQNRDTLVIEAKATPQDLVSGADREVEDLIRAAFPDDAILGEEGGATAGDSGFTWVIDPIDGTLAYLAGLPHWCVVIALLQGADTVAAVTAHPLGHEVFTAIKGQGAWVNGAPLRCNPDHRIDNSLIALGASHRTSPDHVAGGLARLVTPDTAGGVVLATAPLVFAPLNAVVDAAPVDARANA